MLNLATLTEPVYIKCTFQEYPSIAPLLKKHGYNWAFDIDPLDNCLNSSSTHIRLTSDKLITGTNRPLYSYPRHTIQDLLPPPMPLEEIFVTFLKSQRAFSAWKRGVATRNSTRLTPPIAYGLHRFTWSRTPEGWNYWNSLHTKLAKLCRHFNLDSEDQTIDVNKCLKMR
jgi:hypothetical protein